MSSENKKLRELLKKVKDEKAVNQWHFCIEDLLEAIVEEMEKKK